MAKKSLLLVDADSKSLRTLEVSLRKGGFSVTTAVHAADALEKLRHAMPDLILSDTKLPGGTNGFELVAELKRRPETAAVPVMFLSSEVSVDKKVAGLELGVEDYLTKPIYIKEVLTRVRVLLDKRDQQTVERRERAGSFSGQLGDMGLIDLMQTVELGRKTGRMVVHAGRERGQVVFRDGKVCNARCGRLSGERAFYRMLVWGEGSFTMEFVAHGEPDVIELSTQGLLMEGVRRVDEWGRLAEQLPAVEHVFDIDFHALRERLAQIPDEVNALLKMFDGRRTLLQVIDQTDFGDLEALELASKLFFEGLITDATARDAAAAPARPDVEPWLHEPVADDVDNDHDHDGLLVPNDTIPPSSVMPAGLAPPRLESILAPPEGLTAPPHDVVSPPPPPTSAEREAPSMPPVELPRFSTLAPPWEPAMPPPSLTAPAPSSLAAPPALTPPSIPAAAPALVATPAPTPSPRALSAPPAPTPSPRALAAPPAPTPSPSPAEPMASSSSSSSSQPQQEPAPRPLPGPAGEPPEARAVVQRAAVNAATWSSTMQPQPAEDGWEDVLAPTDEPPSPEAVEAGGTRPPALVSVGAAQTSDGEHAPPVSTPDDAAVGATTADDGGAPQLSGPPTIIEPAREAAEGEDLAARIDAQLVAQVEVQGAAQADAQADAQVDAQFFRVPAASTPPPTSTVTPSPSSDPDLPPELAAPSTGFDDTDTDSARAAAAAWEGPASVASSTSERRVDLATAAVPEPVPEPAAAPARPGGAGTPAVVDDGIHDRRTELDLEPLPEIDRFGISRTTIGAGVVLFFAAALITLWVVRRADRADRAAAAAVEVVDAGDVPVAEVDAGVAPALATAAVDAGPAADAGPALDAGTTAAVGAVVDAGAVVDTGAVVDAAAVASIAMPTVDAGAAAPSDVADAGDTDEAPDDEQAEYDRQLKRAEMLARRGDYGRSVRAYKAALALRRDSVTAHLGLGEAFYELDNLTAALTHLERARVLAPKDPQVYVLLGAAYQSANRKADAVGAYERYLALSPDGKMAHDVRAILRGLKN